MENQRFLTQVRGRALQLAGAIALGTAGYHGISGDRILRAMELRADDMEFVTGTFQIGTMGWVAGGVLLLGAARMDSAQARNWIVGVTTVLFGIPAFGTLALTGGQVSLGGVLLAAVVALGLWGRALPATVEAAPSHASSLALASH